MTLKPLFRVGVFSAILCLSAAWSGVSLAQDGRVSLPDLSPEQIVQDVKITFDNRAGTQEYAAPTFDPFENRSDVAGSASLRTVTQAVSIDGQNLQDGAILDLAFYYNQISDSPHTDRGFETVVFLSGAKAANVLRDSRALECATDVQRTVFDQSFHLNSGFHHPYGHYYGHRRFGHRSFGGRSYGHNRGFGHGNFRRGFDGGGFGRNRFGGWRRRDGRIVDGGIGNGGRGRGRNRNDRDFNNERRSDDDRNDVRSNRISRDEAKRRNGRVVGQPIKENRFERRRQGGQTDGQTGAQNQNRDTRNRNRQTRSERNDTRQDVGARSRNARRNIPSRQQIDRVNNTRIRVPRATQNETARNETSRRDVIKPNSGPKSRRRVATQPTRQRSEPAAQSNNNTARSSVPQTQRPEIKRAEIKRPEIKRPEVKKPESKRPEPRSNNQNSNRSRSKPPKRTQKRRVPTRRSTPVRRNEITKPKPFNFFPNDFVGNYRNGGQNVITSVSLDCTREELLSVHIPADRLDAARFDGLTILALDRKGAEFPIFIPANYLEGLRLATSGQYDAQLMRFDGRPPLSTQQGQNGAQPQTSPRLSVPSRVTPNGFIASCPTGSVYQPDNGTCLITPTVQSGTYPQP